MKRVGIIMDDELHKQLKHMAVNEGRKVTDIIVELVKAGKIRAIMQNKSFMQYVVDLIKKDLDNKKEQSR